MDKVTCPKCGSEEFEYGEVHDHMPGMIHDTLKCESCGSVFIAEYKIVRCFLSESGLFP